MDVILAISWRACGYNFNASQPVAIKILGPVKYQGHGSFLRGLLLVLDLDLDRVGNVKKGMKVFALECVDE